MFIFLSLLTALSFIVYTLYDLNTRTLSQSAAAVECTDCFSEEG